MSELRVDDRVVIDATGEHGRITGTQAGHLVVKRDGGPSDLHKPDELSRDEPAERLRRIRADLDHIEGRGGLTVDLATGLAALVARRPNDIGLAELAEARRLRAALANATEAAERVVGELAAAAYKAGV